MVLARASALALAGLAACGGARPRDADARFARIQVREASLERALLELERARPIATADGDVSEACVARERSLEEARAAAQGVCAEVVRGDADAALRCERARSRVAGVEYAAACGAQTR